LSNKEIIRKSYIYKDIYIKIAPVNGKNNFD
jgi:hypothetical protein